MTCPSCHKRRTPNCNGVCWECYERDYLRPQEAREVFLSETRRRSTYRPPFSGRQEIVVISYSLGDFEKGERT